jgi:anti-sigma regulatory factor (Ser/Thr protein kinase)
MIGHSELRIACWTDASRVRSLRHALGEFLKVFNLDQEFVEDVLLASGEVLANAVEHGAGAEGGGMVELVACGRDGMLSVDIRDGGRFIERTRVSGRGFGLGIVRRIAREVEIESADGTRVRMLFEAPK